GVGGELIHKGGQRLVRAGERIVNTQAGVFAEFGDGVAAERVRQIIWCDLVVRTVADPGLCDMAMPALLEFFYDVREPAAEHAASCGSAEQTAQSTGKDIAQAAAGLCAGTSWHAAWFATEQSAEDVPKSATGHAGPDR